MRTIKYIIMALIALALSSCNLDLKIENELTDPDIVTNVESARNCLVPAYRDFPSYMLFQLSLLSNDFDDTGFSASEDKNSFEVYILSTYENHGLTNIASFFWSDLYKTISDAENARFRALDFLNADNKKNINEQLRGKQKDELKHIIAEADILKAYCYFYLLRLYASPYNDNKTKGIIIRTDIDSPSNARASKAECIKVIEELLKNAEELLKNNSFNTECSNLILNQAALYQIRAKVYQYIGDDKKCLEACNDFYNIVNKKNIVYTNYNQAFWAGQDVAQSTWSIEQHNDNFYREINGMNNIETYKQCYVVSKILNFDTSDPRYGIYVLPEDKLKGSLFEKGTQIIGKYNLSCSFDVNPIPNYSEMRPAEVLFIEAEILIKQKQFEKAAKILKDYYKGWDCGISPNKSEEENMKIFQETKQKEFIGENINFFDIKRWGLEKYLYNYASSVRVSIKAGDYRFTLPIPRREMLFNDNLKEQNPGWPVYKFQ